MDENKPVFIILQNNLAGELQKEINNYIEKGYWPLRFNHYDRMSATGINRPVFYCTMYFTEKYPVTFSELNEEY